MKTHPFTILRTYLCLWACGRRCHVTAASAYKAQQKTGAHRVLQVSQVS